MASLFLTPLLFYVPKAVLAATIIVAVLGLVDLHVFRLTARFSKADFTALVLTVVLTLAMGVEVGLVTGDCGLCAVASGQVGAPSCG